MAENSAISWTDHTWNPWIGCQKVSPACDGCYAEALMDKRMGRVEWGGPGKGAGTRVRTSAATWHDPIRWNKRAEKDGTRPFVFCASLADIFDNQVPAEWRRDAFAVMRRTPRLVYLLLTKRPGNIVRLSEEAGGLPVNAATGTTVEDQERAAINLRFLLEAKQLLPPLFAFTSCEPLLGPIDLGPWLPGGYECATECGWRSGGAPPVEKCQWCGWEGDEAGEICPDCGRQDFGGVCPACGGNAVHGHPDTPCLDWVIAGGETDQGGHKARPMHPDWVRSLRDQCAAAGVPFHFKQSGEWLGGDQIPEDEVIPSGTSNDCGILGADDNRRVWRVGKARAGRLLDGIEHNARPIVREIAHV